MPIFHSKVYIKMGQCKSVSLGPNQSLAYSIGQNLFLFDGRKISNIFTCPFGPIYFHTFREGYWIIGSSCIAILLPNEGTIDDARCFVCHSMPFLHGDCQILCVAGDIHLKSKRLFLADYWRNCVHVFSFDVCKRGIIHEYGTDSSCYVDTWQKLTKVRTLLVEKDRVWVGYTRNLVAFSIDGVPLQKIDGLVLLKHISPRSATSHWIVERGDTGWSLWIHHIPYGSLEKIPLDQIREARGCVMWRNYLAITNDRDDVLDLVNPQTLERSFYLSSDTSCLWNQSCDLLRQPHLFSYDKRFSDFWVSVLLNIHPTKFLPTLISELIWEFLY